MKSCFLVLSVLAVTYAAPRPNDLKIVSIEDNEIPTKKVVKGVSAQFGGYRASAGLGGSESGGALFAGAEAPGAQAGAGVFGGSAGGSSGASAVSSSEYGSYGHSQAQAGGGFFDRIFAIPINVLHSVNGYVQTKNGPRRVYHHGEGAGVGAGVGVSGAEAGAGVGAGAGAGAGVSAGAGVGASAGVGADTGLRFNDNGVSGASASASAGGVRPGGKPDYDKIFNIPITALKSVNDFLNG